MLIQRRAAVAFTAALLLSGCASPTPQVAAVPTASITPQPPTQTDTPTALPPTATATLPPPPRTFTEGFDAPPAYWQFLQAGGPGALLEHTVEAGALRLAIAPDLWAYAIYSGPLYEDVRVDAVVSFGSPGASAGVICRYDASQGWYEFNIHADQTYTILFGQWLADGIARYVPLVVSTSEEIRPDSNEIGLDCTGSVLTPYVNTVQLRRRQETQHILARGQVGISAAAADAGGQAVSFDWVSVGEP